MKKSQIALLSVLFCANASRATVPSEWQASQDIPVSQRGLVKVRLPMETLGMLQPSLADLRLLDALGNEYPYVIDRPEPIPGQDLPLENMTAMMSHKKTIMTGTVPATMQTTGFETVVLVTPTDDFLKPISLEGSKDGKKWTMILHQAPIFKQSGDPWSSTLRFAKGSWTHLRITLDDSETEPLRIAQIRLRTTGRPLADLQEFEPKILDQASDGHRTELRLQLPAEGLPLHALRFDVSDTTFRRPIRVANREFSGGEFREIPSGQGSIYRISLGSHKTEQLVVPVQWPSWNRQITVIIENGDSPPLAIRRVWVQVIPRDLIFDAPAPGIYRLSLGNPQATARQYDVATLRGALREATFQRATLGPIGPNVNYRAPESELERIEEEGSDINTDPWMYRKKVIAEPLSDQAALWRIELDPEAIAHFGNRLESLRLVRKNIQLPYVVDHAGVERSLAPGLGIQANAPKGKSLWTIDVPHAGMPLTRLRFMVSHSLFQRQLTLYEYAEEVEESSPAPPRYRHRRYGLFGMMANLIDRPYRSASAPNVEMTSNGKPKRILGYAHWVRTKAGSPEHFELVLQQRPQTGQLILETDNGDNAAIHLESVQAYYHAPRLLFRAKSHKSPLYLYYGQPEVSAPQYDLNLIADQLLATPPQEARLEAEEILKAMSWWESPIEKASSGKRYFFWGVMVLVVLGLLVVIAKLLPEESASKNT